MFSAKQQKTPVSRTISAPERKGVKQMAGPQSSMANRGVIQRMEAIYYHSSPEIIVNDEVITFTGPLDNGARLERIRQPNQYVAVFSFRKLVYADRFGNVRFRNQTDDYVMPRNQEFFHVRSGVQNFESVLTFNYVAHIPRNQLAFFLDLEKNGIIYVSVLFEPQIDQEKMFDIYGMTVSVTNREDTHKWEAETSFKQTFHDSVEGEHLNAKTLQEETYYNKGAHGVYLSVPEFKAASEKMKKSYAKGVIAYRQRGGVLDVRVLETMDKRLKDAYINEKYKRGLFAKLF